MRSDTRRLRARVASLLVLAVASFFHPKATDS